MRKCLAPPALSLSIGETLPLAGKNERADARFQRVRGARFQGVNVALRFTLDSACTRPSSLTWRVSSVLRTMYIICRLVGGCSSRLVSPSCHHFSTRWVPPPLRSVACFCGCRSTGWVVLFVPDAWNLVQKGIYCQPSPVFENLYDLPVQASFALLLLLQLLVIVVMVLPPLLLLQLLLLCIVRFFLWCAADAVAVAAILLRCFCYHVLSCRLRSRGCPFGVIL